MLALGRLDPILTVPTFRKQVVSPGLYTTGDGSLSTADPARIKRWHETIQGILARGYNPPLSWGHDKKATPHTPEDHAFWSSRFNAGKVVGSELDDQGNLVLTSQAAGLDLVDGALVGTATLPNGTTVPTSIDKVSIGVRDWKDGSGKVWEDAPIHLALVPLPVWEPEGGQPGFEAAEDDPAVLRFGTDTFLGTEAAPVGKETAAEDDKPPVLNKYVEECKVALAGLPQPVILPADTDGTNILERICIVCGAMKSALKGGQDINTPVTEDTQGGSYMSTDIATHPLVRALVAERDATKKAALVAEVAGLERQGLARSAAVKLREEVTATNFGTDAEGRLVEPDVAKVIAMLKASLPTEEAFKAQFFSSRTGTDVVEAEAPEDAQTGDRKHAKVLAEYLKTVRRADPPLAKAV